RDWQTLEGLAANEDLPWFENKQTLSDLSTAYLPLELVEGIAQKLIAYLVESRGLDPEIEFELYDSAQINVMRQGSFIGRHYDGAIKDGEPEPFVFLLGLNSDYKGGEFLTYRGESSLVESSSKLVERSLLILNQSEYHSVNEVREGDRISIVIRVAPKSL
ncbi:MAG: 2OG-Fe(II) oxygenase, partial [Pseudomonadota bacterium]